MHGQTYQWLRTSDTGGRALDLYGDNSPLWNFTAHPAADITLINIGTNDANPVNNISTAQFTQSYKDLITTILADVFAAFGKNFTDPRIRLPHEPVY